jgi:glycosyltransferase involved in cell wall biosynthesis
LPALAGLRRRARGGLVVLFEAHDYFARLDHLVKRRPSDFRRCLAERWCLPRTDGLICITGKQRDLYREAFPDLPLLHAPLGCIHAPPGADAETRRGLRKIAYVGHLHAYKGSHLLVELAADLRDSGIRIVAFGASSAQGSRFRRALEKRGAGHVMEFHPFLPPAELHRRLASEVSACIVPLQDTFYSRYLTCPVKALDSMAHGLPVLASDLDSTREVLRDAAIYCPPSEAPAFAEAARRLLGDPREYQSYSERARTRAAQLRWEDRAARIVGFAEGSRKPRLSPARCAPAGR